MSSSTWRSTSATPSSTRASGTDMSMASTDLAAIAGKPVVAAPARGKLRDLLRRHPTIVAGGALLALMILMAVFAPWLGTVDPQALSPIHRLRPPSAQYWFGTDMLG